MGKKIECKQCNGQMKATTLNNRSSGKQLIGLLLFLVGLGMVFSPLFILGIIVLILAGMIFSGKTTKVWRCMECGYFFERA